MIKVHLELFLYIVIIRFHLWIVLVRLPNSHSPLFVLRMFFDYYDRSALEFEKPVTTWLNFLGKYVAAE